MEYSLYNSPYILGYRRRLPKTVPKPTKTATLKQSVKKISKEYCAESSISGLKHIVDDNVSCFERYVCESILAGELVYRVRCNYRCFQSRLKDTLHKTGQCYVTKVRDACFE